jgi:hypothetical protein
MNTRTRNILDELSNICRIKAEIAIKRLDEREIKYYVSEGRRTLLTQCLYALQGRLDDINFVDLQLACASAGIRPPDKNKITWTLNSVHIDGNAIDVVPMKEVKDKDGNIKYEIDWNNQSQDIINAFKDAGFIWGGDWDKNKDPPHFELR